MQQQQQQQTKPVQQHYIPPQCNTAYGAQTPGATFSRLGSSPLMNSACYALGLILIVTMGQPVAAAKEYRRQFGCGRSVHTHRRDDRAHRRCRRIDAAVLSGRPSDQTGSLTKLNTVARLPTSNSQTHSCGTSASTRLQCFPPCHSLHITHYDTHNHPTISMIIVFR